MPQNDLYSSVEKSANMPKIICLIFLLAIYSFGNNLQVNNFVFSYTTGKDIDHFYIEDKNSTVVMQIYQKNLWINAPIDLNLLSAADNKIKLIMIYKGNNDLGYIYTFSLKNQRIELENATLFHLQQNLLCNTHLSMLDKNFIKITETPQCSDLKKITINLRDLEFAAKKYKLKNILTSNEVEILLRSYPLSTKTLPTYNNIAYYLQKAGANKEAIYLLEKILKKHPNKTVAYYNIGDAYWAVGEKEKAKQVYRTYIKQMKAKGKEKRIPKIVLRRAL